MTLKTYLSVIESGYSWDELYLLQLIMKEREKTIEELFEDTFSSKIMIILLQAIKRKGLLTQEGLITEEGTRLLKFLELGESTIENIDIPREVVKEVVSFPDRLHTSLQVKLESLIGKKQVKGFGGVYFIPTILELEEFLERFKRRGYKKLYDEKKIEQVLLNHIENCVRKNSYAPAIKYYIYKDGTGSPLAAALENYEEEIKESKIPDQNPMLI